MAEGETPGCGAKIILHPVNDADGTETIAFTKNSIVLDGHCLAVDQVVSVFSLPHDGNVRGVNISYRLPGAPQGDAGVTTRSFQFPAEESARFQQALILYRRTGNVQDLFGVGGGGGLFGDDSDDDDDDEESDSDDDLFAGGGLFGDDSSSSSSSDSEDDDVNIALVARARIRRGREERNAAAAAATAGEPGEDDSDSDEEAVEMGFSLFGGADDSSEEESSDDDW